MRDAFELAALKILDDEFCDLPLDVRDAIAERTTRAVLSEVERDGQEHRWIAYDELGNPRCSWCGAMPGPELPRDHFQYGVFCTCTAPVASDVGTA